MRGDFAADKSANNVTLTFVVPSFANSVALEVSNAFGATNALPPGKADYDRDRRIVRWVVPKFQGNAEVVLRAKVTHPCCAILTGQIILHSSMHSRNVDLKRFGNIRFASSPQPSPSQRVV